MPKVSIVILNWNGYKDTIELFKSVKLLNHSNCEINTIIVDNASTNESITKIKSAISSQKAFELIQNQSNFGFAGGNNIGIKKAISLGSDYVMVLNNDTILDSNIVFNLVSFMENKPQVGAASPKMYFAKGFEFHKNRYNTNELGKVIWYAGGDIDWKNMYGSNHGVDQFDTGQFDQPLETEFGSGACLFLRSSVLKDVGLFNEKYFLYLEDTDLCIRIRQRGYLIYFVPSAILWHKVSQSSGIGSLLNDYFITRNRLLFASKYATLRTNIALFKESIRFLINGREWQKKGVMDYYLKKFGKGSWQN